MTEHQLRLANGTELRVEWRGIRDWEKARGRVTALIYRRRDERDILSVEITQDSSPRSVVICRPEEIFPVGNMAEWQSILGGKNCEIQHTEKLAESSACTA